MNSHDVERAATRWSHFFLGFLCGAFAFAFLLGMSAPCKADEKIDPRAGEWWGVATLASYHAERDRGYNERNFGVGLEYHIDTDWHIAAGTYKNSFYRQTTYAAVGYELFQFGYLHVGAALVALTGYTEGKIDFVLAPVASLEFGRVGINLVPITPYVVGLQAKVRF